MGTIGVVVVAGALTTVALVWPHAKVPARHNPHHLADERARSPGIHRAKPAELAAIDRVARAESAKVIARKKALLPSVPATTWVNLGPTDSLEEVNFFSIAGVDSGRPNNIVVDPRDGNVVYMAVSGGGLWKSFDFLSAKGPTWAPTMDTQPNLAVGALALDPDHPDTIYVGNGDFVDTAGDTLIKSTDGGGTWSAPVTLAATHPNGFDAHASSVRSIGAHGNQVLVATDVGLFASSDAGTSFHLVDLPNAGGAQLVESLWSIVSIGGGAWVASGVTACDVGQPPPQVFGGFDPDLVDCPAGNNVALWRSTDGVTWTLATTPPRTGAGNTLLAAGQATDPAHTVVYGLVGGIDGFRTRGFWRSNDGGATYVDATGILANPTLLSNQDDSCLDINVGHEQSWYNQAITVDPTNPDHVLVGGNLCGMRTLTGRAASPTWELVSHWLPGPGFGETANGRLAYVHADWHTAASVVINGKLWTFAGTDGGIFSSTNLFDPTTKAESVVWTHHNKGLVTHLMYSVASGDPASGDPFVVFSGLQDNGTRFRTDPANPSAFNQPIGGDGIGATVHHSTSGTTYWGSVEFGRLFCKPAEVDCSTEVPEAPDASSHWHGAPQLAGRELDEDAIAERMRERARKSGEDEEPFFIHYADVETDTTGQSVLTHTDEQVFVSSAKGTGFIFTPISQDLTGDPTGAGFSNVSASRVTPGLYGAAGLVSAKPFFVTKSGNTMTTWTVAQPIHPTGSTARLTGAASIDFPPTLPAGKNPGDVYIGSFTGTMNDAARTPPPDDKGHLWRTSDGGATWQSIVGADPNHRLPNLPIYVAKYDPITATTIYAGTQVGVYITVDDGVTWNRMGDNFPIIPVRDMYVAKNQDFIRAATYGRGMWEIYPSASASQGAPGNGDFDRNLAIDWIDVGAMSARLSETPATVTAPLYSWILDMTGSDAGPLVQAIDDNDLQAQLAKFGGHP